MIEKILTILLAVFWSALALFILVGGIYMVWTNYNDWIGRILGIAISFWLSVLMGMVAGTAWQDFLYGAPDDGCLD